MPPSGLERDDELVFEFDEDEAEGAGDVAVSGSGSGSISISISSRSKPDAALPVAAIFDGEACDVDGSEGPSASAKEESVLRVGIF